ncbi:MAG: protein-ADP-ribose hydrolase [Oscillospiraceae bacterium]|nr:protein-ADP-ribose hydrolase [Oscillospiraceae bacterium]
MSELRGKRENVIKYLLSEREQYKNVSIPAGDDEQFALYRALVNVRPAAPVSEGFLKIQDEFLQLELSKKHITTLDELSFSPEGICLWQGDISTLACDAIVNAANSGMTGCYVPCHNCIDNVIHTYAGVQLRLECDEIMKAQGFEEPVGKAKITKAYNLPSRHVIHTVGPMIRGEVTAQQDKELAGCYRSCLELAEQNGITSIAFCCISTGVFCFPNERAAHIAIDEVKRFKAERNSAIKVIFNVFKDEDRLIYERLLEEKQ